MSNVSRIVGDRVGIQLWNVCWDKSILSTNVVGMRFAKPYLTVQSSHLYCCWTTLLLLIMFCALFLLVFVVITAVITAACW